MKIATVSRYILDQLAAFGIKRMYGVAGDTQLHLVAETATHPSISFVSVCNENAAGFMAAAEAMLTGLPGVCIATSGPGVANMLNGLGEAYGDKLPVLALTGQVELSKIGTEAKQYLEQQVMMRPLAAYSAQVVDADAVGKVLPLALLKSMSRKQLTHVSVPKDLLTKTTTAQVMARPIGLDPHIIPSASALKAALDAIGRSRRPLILAGVGAHNAMPDVVKLAQLWGAGIVTSLGAKGSISRQEPLYLYGLGQGGSAVASELLSKCDLLLVIGCNWWPDDYAIADAAQVIQIDINAESVGCGKAPHIALIGEAQEVTWQIRSELKTQAEPSWVEIVANAKLKWELHLAEDLVHTAERMHPAVVMTELEKLSLTDAIYTIDTGDHTIWFNRHFHGLCHRVLFSGKWRTMGFGLPAAIAAALVHPGKRVICVTGDGCLNMVLTELATVVRENLPVTIVVLNNHAYSIEKNRMLNAGLPTIGVDLPAIDYVKAAEACGMSGESVADEEELRQALGRALEGSRPYLIAAEVSEAMLPHVKL